MIQIRVSQKYFSNIFKSAFGQIRSIRSFLTFSDAQSVLHAFVSSHLDDCYSLFAGLPRKSINRLQLVQIPQPEFLQKLQSMNTSPPFSPHCTGYRRRGRLLCLALSHSSALFSLFFYLVVIYCTLFCIMHSGKASPIIIYDREQLLSIGLTVKNTFSPPPTTNKGVLPWRGLPAVPGTRRRGRRKRGSRAGVLVRLRKRENRPPLPSILLANVQSLDNKLDELRSRMAFQRDIKFCNVMVFTETWLDPSIPDSAIVPEGVSIHRQDRTTNSGKSKGGGVCFMVNNLWCSDVRIISSGCTPDLEHLMIRCRPYYIPREFTSVILTAVYDLTLTRPAPTPTRHWTSCMR